MTDVHPPPSDAPVRPAYALAERWADFTKAFAIYPETNSRVRATLDAFFAALEAAHAASSEEAEVEVLFHRDALWLGEEECELRPGTNLHWLHDRIHKGALAGVGFAAAVPTETMLDFTRRLLRHYTRKDLETAFEDLWPKTFEGLRLVERRFEGEFGEEGVSGGGRTRSWGPSHGRSVELQDEEELVRYLAREESIQTRLGMIQARIFARTDGNEAQQRVDLLGRIVKLLPPDTTQEPRALVDMVVQVLDRIERLVGEARTAGDEQLNKLLFAASRGLLARQSRRREDRAERLRRAQEGDEPDAAAPDAPLRRGHEGDEAVIDDKDGLLADLQDLPAPLTEELTAENVGSRPEEVGVYLHNLVQAPSATVARRAHEALATRLSSFGAAERGVLRQYVVAFWFRADKESRDEGYERLLELLLATRAGPLLRAEGYVSADIVRETFPRTFGLYLDGLDPRDLGHVEELEQVLTQIGSERFLLARDALLSSERLLEPGRLDRFLEGSSRAYLPLARLVLEVGDATARQRAVAYLRRLDLRAKEACLLYVTEDAAELPATYLMALAQPNSDGTYPEHLRAQAASLLCRFVRKRTDDPAGLTRRVYAIKVLVNFPGLEVRDVLREILGARRFLVLPREPAEVRKAAREVLVRHGWL